MLFSRASPLSNSVINHSLRHILRNTGLLGGVQVLHLLLSVVRNKFTAIFIGAAGIGTADLYSRIAEFIGNFTNFGLGLSGVRRISQLYEEEPDGTTLREHIAIFRSWGLLAGVFGGCVMLLLSPVLALLFLKNADRWGECCALAPLVFFSAVYMIEVALLRATRQLKKLALCTLFGAVSTLGITVPSYALFGSAAIIPVLLLSLLSLLGVHLWASTRHYPYRLNFRGKSFLAEGLPMLRLGLSFVLAGVVSAGAELLVRSFINWQANEVLVGYYSVGFTLIVSYARFIFVAVDADYYPRLSAVVHHREEMNVLVNRQIDALVMLMSPFLIAFAVGLPVIICLLYTEDFLCVAPMVLAALCHMYFKAVYTPVAYLSIAGGEARLYFVMELLYNLIFVTAVVLGYSWGGLLGAGVGLSLANFCDMLAINICYAYRYAYRMERSTLLHLLVQFLLLLSSILLCSAVEGVEKYAAGGILFCISLLFSHKMWRKKG